MRHLLLLIVSIFCCQAVFAQQYPLFTNFMMNRYAYNPAVHTDSAGICADLVYRNQWTGIEGSPTTMIAGLRGRIKPLPVAVGGYFFNDQAGVIKRTGGYGMFNVVKSLGPDTRLSAGAAIGFYSLELDGSYRASEEADQVLPNALGGKKFLDFNAGLYLEHRALYAGVSVPQIGERDFNFSDLPETSTLRRHFYALTGYKHRLSGKMTLEPMALLKFLQDAPMQWDAGLKLHLDKFWVGGTYRSNAAMAALAGINLGNLELGYAYDITTSELNKASNGSHELSLHLCFGKPKDSDGDGCPDKDDKCPDRPGPKENDCCPEESPDELFAGNDDTDGDGILDQVDKCPNIPGLPELQGCPFGDRDGDGIRNDIDKCPDLPGVASNQGCPIDDRDVDGIVDKFDRCPDEPGSLANAGCPSNDTDGDGVPDELDRCPNTKGLPGSDGCPIASASEREALDLAIQNLYFDTNKSDIWTSSFPYLDRLSEVMIKHPDWRLKISGHTDSRASTEYNLALSKRRSEAVMFYMMNRGMKREQLVVEYYGEAKPAAANVSEGGMQLNRRVEMAFIFE